MATIGEVNAQIPETGKRDETQDVPRAYYFGVFFDGTSNNMVDEVVSKKFRSTSITQDRWELEPRSSIAGSFENGANQLTVIKEGDKSPKYSNVAILHSLYQGMSQQERNAVNKGSYVKIFNIYVEGVGTDAIDDNVVVDKINNWWEGTLRGKGKTGVAQLVCKAISMIRTRLASLSEMDRRCAEVHFDVYGFSRGATCARLFTFLAVRKTGDKLPCEGEFESSMASAFFKAGYLYFLDGLGFKSVTVDFLGLYDSVSSIGGFSVDSYDNNVTDYGLYSPSLAGVKNTFHLCAMDEFREHFALTDIGDAVKMNDNAELFIPGCHTDVGGGYVDEDNSSINLTIGKLQKNSSQYFGAKEFNRFSFPANRMEISDHSVMEACFSTFRQLGWVDRKNNYLENSGVDAFSLVAHITRRVKCGYSNIPLSMMRERSVIKLKRIAFQTVPMDYQIDSMLFGEWSNMLMAAVTESGRKWCYPGGAYNSLSYQKMRKYLHFSSTSSIGLTPSRNKTVFCRYIYHGNKGDSQRRYLSEAY